ncbi:MAG: substrate-binding domain-containing protein [Candidatus Humimicrobiaceae bacterium]
MCRKYGFARTTIDMGVNELIEDKVLFSVVGSGTYVSAGYRSNMNALMEGITSWGIVLPDLIIDIYPLFIRGVEDFARQHHINAVICNTDNDVRKQNEYIFRLIDSGATGIIIIPAISKDNDLSGFIRLKEKKIPFVFCNRTVESMSSCSLVCSNDFYGGYIATKHLVEKKYNRIAYIARERYKASMDRYCGYVAALTEKGIEIDQSIVCLEPLEENNRNGDCGYEFAKGILESNNPPNAFFCFNDRIAVSAYRALRECGLKVSDDVGLIGYDNISVCEALEVKLTSVCFMNYEMGRRSAQILYKKLQGEKLVGNDVFIYQPELVIRESCMGRIL